MLQQTPLTLEMKPVRLKRWLTVIGTLNLTFFATRAILSYFLVTIAPFGVTETNEARFFSSLAQKFDFLGSGFQNLLTGNSVFRQESIFSLAYSLPILLSSIAFLILLACLAKHRQYLDSGTPQTLFRWAIAFVLVSAFTTPLLVQDFWLSNSWGQMIVAGVNPYHADLTLEFARDIPLDYFDQRMTYGPLWAVISGCIVWLGGGNGLVAAIFFKMLLVGAWVATLRLVWKLLEERSLQHQCVGLAIFGWLPLSVIEIAGDGHNDIVMVLLMMCWLYCLEQQKTKTATFALAAASLVKYVSAPLLLLDLLHLRYSQKRPWWNYLFSVPAAAILVIVIFSLFYRSPDFFDATLQMRNWHALTPREAIISFSRLLRTPYWLKYIPLIFFPATAFYFIIRYLRRPAQEAFRQVVLAVMCAILFGVMGHLWSWFLLWGLAVAALLPGAALTRWILGVALAMPFAIFVLVELPQKSPFIRWELTVMGLYTFVGLWFLFAPRKWFPKIKIEENVTQPVSSSLV